MKTELRNGHQIRFIELMSCQALVGMVVPMRCTFKNRIQA